MKKIMILGAGGYQAPLIKTAKEMGLKPLVVGSPGNYPGLKYAHKIFPVNFCDKEAVLKIAEEEHIDAILTSGMDAAVPAIGYVCSKMNLPGITEQSASCVTDKWSMKERFYDGNVRTPYAVKINITGNGDGTPDTVSISSVIKDKLRTECFCYPFLLKASDNSGSRGIVKVNDEEHLESAILLVTDNTNLDYFLMEAFTGGEELGVEAFIQDNKIHMMLPNGKYIFTGDTNVPIGHFAPCNLSQEVLDDIRVQIQAAVDSCGLNDCPVNADLILSGNQAYIIEIAGRPGATGLPELVSLCNGYNYYEKLIRAALGEHPDFTPVHNRAAAYRILMPEADGVLKSQSYDGEMIPGIEDVHFDFDAGTSVHKFRNNSHRCGHVLTSGKNLAEADSLLHQVLSNIHIEIE